MKLQDLEHAIQSFKQHFPKEKDADVVFEFPIYQFKNSDEILVRCDDFTMGYTTYSIIGNLRNTITITLEPPKQKKNLSDES